MADILTGEMAGLLSTGDSTGADLGTRFVSRLNFSEGSSRALRPFGDGGASYAPSSRMGDGGSEAPRHKPGGPGGGDQLPCLLAGCRLEHGRRTTTWLLRSGVPTEEIGSNSLRPARTRRTTGRARGFAAQRPGRLPRPQRHRLAAGGSAEQLPVQSNSRYVSSTFLSKASFCCRLSLLNSM